MNVSWIKPSRIHAKALKRRFGNRATLLAEERARHCAARGDDEGCEVWLRVAAVAGMLPNFRMQHPPVHEMH